MNIPEHTLTTLEFPAIRNMLAQHASFSASKQMIAQLVPSCDAYVIGMALAQTREARYLLDTYPDLSIGAARDIRDSVRLAERGGVLDAGALLEVARTLGAARRFKQSFASVDAKRIPLLYDAIQRLPVLPAIEDRIERSINHDGEVLDSASPKLGSLRSDIRITMARVQERLQHIVSSGQYSDALQEAIVTVRNGRYVVPVKASHKRMVKGLVHDQSGKGITLYIEPLVVVELNNKLRELQLDEADEVARILAELSDMVGAQAAYIRLGITALAELDFSLAKARFAGHLRAVEPIMIDVHNNQDPSIVLIKARHPLIDPLKVVPTDISMPHETRITLITGPNTGGKTVSLKTTGLLALMAQSGLFIPANEGSTLPVFGRIFADIGDEQSIEASLSTFSAHLKNLGDILRSATPDSLVLIDELGSGTDPSEGAALGGSILETLTRRAATTIATTHLGQLKLLATEVDGVVNASLQFDAVQLAPTYRLLKGIPGRSYGLSIARRLQLPEDVIVRAEERLPHGERDLAVLLSDVEAREAVLGAREQVMDREQEKLRARLATVTDRELKAREREREAEKSARQEARKYLLEARGQVERAIAEIRTKAGEQADALEESARAARRAVEDAAAAQGLAAEAVQQRAAREKVRTQVRAAVEVATPRAGTPQKAPAPLAEGDRVLVGTLDNKSGQVLSVRGQEARVVVGSLTVTVPLSTLTRSSAPPPPAVKVTYASSIPEADPLREVDVRGLRVDEVDDQVLQAIDTAVRSDMRELRIIHGKGTGALRSRVGEMLKKDTRVAGFRLGAWNEGGAGVTVAEFT